MSGVSIEAKEPQIGITEQLDEISAETKGIDFTGPEGKIVFPKFEKPKFTVLPPEPRTIDATVIIVKPEADISLPTLTADVETTLSTAEPSLDDIYAKASQGESESAEYKIQMPIVKLSQFTKPDMKAPKVDISLPSVDIATLKSEVHTQELEGQSEPLKIEGQIEPAGIEKEAVGSSFKMPKLKLPSFGPFSKKGTAGQLDVQAGPGDTKITMPSTLAEAEIQLSQTQDEKADIDVDSTELEIKGKKSIIKVPKIRKPSFGSSQPRAPEVDMGVQSAEGDLSLSKPDAEAKVEITSGEKTISFDPVKAAASEVHMRLPKAELPKLESTADATLPAVDVILSKHDIPGDKKKLPDVSALIVETVKDFRVPDMQPSTEGKELEPEVATASSQRSLESKEVKHSGLEGAITFPKLQMPKFGAFPYTETIAAAAPIAIAKTDVIQPAVAADVEAAVAPIEASALDVKAKVPDRESESAAWKMQVPSVKLPIFTKPDLKAPTVDLSLPSIDVSIAKPEVQMEEHEAETKKLTVESEITPAVIEPGMAESSFKMPKIGMPSFGLFSRKGTCGQHETESSESEAEIPGTAVEGDHQVKQPELESKEGATVGKGLEEDILGEPHLEGETLLPEPKEIKALDVGVSIEAKEPQIGITEQLDEISAETKGIDFTGPERKNVFPKFEKPKFTVLPPEPRTIDATVIIVKPEADISLPTLTADVETTLSTAEPSLDDIHAKASQGESESAEYKIQMPIVKLSQFTKPDMKAPKVDISLPSVDIATLKSEVHTQELEGQSEPLKIEGQIEPAGIEKEAVGSSFKMPKHKLPSFGPFSKKGTAGQLDVQAGPGDTKITMPSTLAEPEIQLSQTQDEKADIDVDSTELEIKGKKSIIKVPKIRKPSFGSSQPRAPEVDMGVQSAEGDLSLSKPDAEAKVEITSGEKTISFDPVKAAASEVHMRLPKAELPKLESTADATLPAVDVILSKHDIPEGDKKKLPGVSALIVETVKDFRVPDMQPSTEGKELEPEVATESSQRSLESKEVKHSGLEGAITFPKFQMPKFGAFPYTETIAAAAPIAIAETDVIQPAVAADVEAAEAPIEASALDVKAKVPDRESESAAWKMQVPSVKLPIFIKPDLKAPTIDLSLPSIDVSIAKPEVQMEEHEAETKKLTVESEITPAVIEPGMAESSFKMPKIGLPSFGLFSRKGTRGQHETESSESEAEIPGTAVEGDHQVKQPELESKEGATVGKGLEEDILGEPHLEGETLLPEPKEIKALDVGVSIEAKEPQIGITEQLDEISAETKGIDFTGPEGKIVFPKFEKPKFTVLPPEPRTIDATVIIVKPEADISLPTLTADVETTLSTAEPSLDDIHAKASQGESESAEYKIQMPIVKLSQFTKPDMKAPKVDISLPSVDIATLKSEVHTQELEGQSEPLKIEGQIEPAGIEKEAVGSSFKMPKLKLPSFGPFSKKGTAGQLDVQAGPGDTKITMPSTLAEAEIQHSQTQDEKADIDVDSTELEIKGKKSIIKAPKIRKPSFGSSQTRAPEVDMVVQSAEGDLSLSKPDAEAKVEITSGEKTISFDPVKAAASEVHMHLPKAELPKLESTADATLPAVDVILSKHDIPEGDKKKLPDVSALIVETVKDFRVPDMQPSTEGKELEPEVATESSQRSLESKEVKHSGLEGAITFPKLQMPKFGAFPYTGTIAAAAPIAIAETDVIQPAVAADVEAAEAPIEASALDVKAKVPDRESESAAWKMQVPSVKLPIFTKPDLKAPTIDLSLPSIDVSIAKPEVQMEEHEAETKKLTVESEITPAVIEPGMAESSFKMPKIGMPSFGLFSRKGTRGQHETESSESEAEIPGTAVEGDHQVKQPELESKEGATVGKGLEEDILGEPHLEGETLLPEPKEIKALDVGVSIEAKEPQIGITEQLDEISAETKGIDFTGPEGKIVFHKFEKPKFTVLPPEPRTIDATVIIVKPEADISLPTLTADVETTLSTAEPSLDDIHTKASQGESESAEYKIQMPIVKLSQFTKPDMKAPKVDISLPSVDIATLKLEVHTQELEGQSEPLKIGQIEPAGIEKEAVGSSFKMPKLKLPSFGPFSKKGTAGQLDVQAGPGDTKITMPSTLAEAEIQLSQTQDEKADIDVDSTELEIKGKKSIIKVPKIRKPSFGSSQPRAPEVDMGVQSAEGDLSLSKPGAEAKVEITSGEKTISFDPVKAAASEVHMRLPKAELPKLESTADATLPAVDVILSKHDIPGDRKKLPDVSALIVETVKDFRVPDMQPSTEGKELEPEVATASSQRSLESKEVKHSGLEGAITFPKLQMPKFGAFPYTETIAAAAPIAIAKTDVIQPAVAADVEAAVAPIEASALDVKAKVPDRESESAAWKMQVPSVKLPIFIKPDLKAPTVDLSLPSIDVSIAKPEVQMEEHEAETKKLTVESEITPAVIEPGMAESSFKMPKIGLPSFGLFSRKGTRGQHETESSESEAEIPRTAVEGDHQVKQPELESKEGATVGKGLEEDILGEPHLEGETLLPEPKEIKALDVRVSIEAKEPQIGITEQLDEISAETKGIDFTGPEGKIVFPKFEKPKFTVLPPEPRTIDATVIIVKPEADISLPTLTADVETTLSTAEPSLDDIYAKASQGESESAEYKIQMPIVKLSQFTKPDMKAPKVDISLPSVDIATLKSEVHTQELEGQSEPLKIEGQIEPAGIEKEAVGSSFKMPKLKLPSFGPFSKKGTAGQLDVQAGPGDTKITMPSTLAEAEIQLSQTQDEKADIDVDSTELEIKGKKSIIKVPKIRKPSFGSSQPRAPEVDMGVQSAEGDLSLSKPDAEAKVEITSGEKTISFDPVKAAASEVHMRLPKAELPKLESTADATLPAVDVILSKHDIPGDRKKLPDVSALIVETVKDFRVPDMQPSTEGKELEPEVATASSQRSLESKEVKHSGLEGAITFPKLQMPKFGAFPYTETIAAAAPIAIAKTDVIQPAVAADVEAAVAPIEASALDVKAKVPDRESESAAWKMQVPSVKLPIFTKPDLKAPTVDLSLPSIDISIAKPEVQMEEHEAETKKLTVESEITPAVIEPGMAESSFKMPKIGMPSFGLFSRKGTRGQHETESSESEAEIPGTAVEGDHQVKQPELESKEGATVGKGLEEDILGEPHLEGETLLPEPKEIKALDVGVSIEAKEPLIGITEQLDEISAETKGIDFTGPEGKIVFPKFEKPKFTVLPPEPRTIDATVIIVKPEADISLPTLTADVETTLSTAEPSLDDIYAKASQGESEFAEYKIQMPIVKLSQFTKPDMKAPKVDISLPSVDIATLKSEVHTQELEGQSEPLKIEGQIEPAGIEKEAVGSSFKMPKLKLPSFGPFSKKGTAGQLDVQAGPGDTKITMPSTLAEPEIQLSQTQDEKADIDVDSTELEIKGKKSKIKAPKIRKPSFGSSQTRATEVDMVVQSAEGDLSLSKPDAEAKVEITSGEKTISFDPVKAAASEVHMHLPKAELPKLESTADATLPAADVILPKHDIPEGDKKKLPDVSALIVETVKDFRVPDMQPSTEGKELEPEVATESSQRSLESKEVKHSGLEGAITFPKFQMPKFGAFPYTETIAAAAPIAIAETDVIQPAVAADVEAAEAPIEASALDVKSKVPDRESESAAWKMQVPSVKLPIFTKPDLKAPTVDLSLSSIDVSIAKPEIQMEEHEAETKKLTVESEIAPAVIEPGMAESSFKMPKIGMPSFGLFSRKGTRGQHETESSESDAEIPGTAVEGDHQVKQPELESKEGATVGKGLEEDILGEPHLEGETLLPEPEEIKALDVGVSIEAKEPQIGITEQLVEISAETKDIDFTGPEGKIVFPKFEKPKFTVLPPEPRTIDATVIIVKPEADISLPTLTADVETTLSTAEPSLDDIHAKASQGESESAEYKIQMPIVKLSQFTKPDMKAPKVDISLPSVDIATLKSEVHTQELEGQSEPLKIGQIEPAGIEKEAVGSSFKMPKLKLPSFGPFSKKGTAGQLDVQAGPGDTKITMPSTLAEAEIQLSQTQDEKADIDVDSTELEIKGKKSIIKVPKIRKPSFGSSQPRAPEVDMGVQSAEGDLSLSKPDAEAKVEITSREKTISFDPVKAAASEVHMRLPKAELPKLESTADATLPAVDVILSKHDIPGDRKKLPDVSALIVETVKDFRVPDMQPSTEGKELEPEVATASSQRSLESKEVKHSGLEGAITFPKLQMPKFGAFPYTETIAAAAPIAIAKTDVIQPAVAADVEAAVAPIEASALDVKAKVPDRESESAAWKMQVPSVKLPIFIKPDLKAPTVDLSLPSIDVSIAKPEVQMEEHEAETKKLTVESEITPAVIEPGMAESSFKMPKIGLPSFGLFSRKGTRGQHETESSESEAEIPGTAVEGDHQVKQPELESKEGATVGKGLEEDILGEPHLEGETLLPEPKEIKALDVRVSIEAKEPQIGITEQLDEISAETKGIDFTGPEGKIVFPKFEKPKFTVLPPEPRTIDATVIIVKPEAEISLPTLRADVETTLSTAEPSLDDIYAKASQGESESAEYKIQMPIVKLSQFTKPDMKAPKVDISLPSVDIATLKSEVHTQELEGQSEPLKIEGQIEPAGIEKEAVGSSFKMPKLKLPSFGPFSKKGTAGQLDVQAGPGDTKITMPSTLAEPEIQLSQTQDEKADIDVDSTELEIKGKKSKIKAPKIRKPSFGSSQTRATEVDMVVQSAEGDLSLSKPDAEAKVEITSGEKTISFDPVKAAASEVHMHLPKAELPKLESTADATLPAADVILPKHDIPEGDKKKLPDVSALIVETVKDFRVPDMQPSTEGKELEPEVATESSQRSLESKEVKHSGLEGAITFPKFQMPKFGAFPYTETIADAAPIAIAETDVIQPAVAADVEAAEAPIEASALDVKSKVPDRESESAAWKMQVPSVKLPIFTKPDLKAPTVDLSLSSIDVSIAKPEIQMEEHEAETKKLTVESEIAPAVIEPGMAESSFKMPKIGMPSFGLFSRKGTRGQHETESSESEAEIPGTAVEGDHQVKQPELESKKGATVGKGLEEDILGEPHLEGETLLPEPEEIKALDVGVSIEAKEPQIGITEQLVEISAETKGIDFTGPEGKIVFPKFEKPKFTVLPPEPRTIDATVIIVKPEADISLPTLTADVETMLSTAEPSLDDIHAKASQGESESAEYKIQMPIVKLSQFTKPDMKAPKVDISLPSVDIATLKSEVHTEELEGQSEPLKIEGQIEPAGIEKEAVGSSFKMPKLKLPSFGPFSKKGTAGQLDVQAGPGDTKITMPSTAAVAEIQLSESESSTKIRNLAMPYFGPFSENDTDSHFEAMDTTDAPYGSDVNARASENKHGELNIPVLSLKLPQFTKTDMNVAVAEMCLPSVDFSSEELEMHRVEHGAEFKKLIFEKEIAYAVTESESLVSSFKMPKIKFSSLQSYSRKGTGIQFETGSNIMESNISESIIKSNVEIEIEEVETVTPAVVPCPEDLFIKEEKSKTRKLKLPAFSKSLPTGKGSGTILIGQPCVEIREMLSEAQAMEALSAKVERPATGSSDDIIQESEEKLVFASTIFRLPREDTKEPESHESREIKSLQIRSSTPSDGFSYDGELMQISIPETFTSDSFIQDTKMLKNGTKILELEQDSALQRLKTDVAGVEIPTLYMKSLSQEGGIELLEWNIQIPADIMAKTEGKISNVDSSSVISVGISNLKAQVDSEETDTVGGNLNIKCGVTSEESETAQHKSPFKSPKIKFGPFLSNEYTTQHEAEPETSQKLCSVKLDSSGKLKGTEVWEPKPDKIKFKMSNVLTSQLDFKDSDASFPKDGDEATLCKENEVEIDSSSEVYSLQGNEPMGVVKISKGKYVKFMVASTEDMKDTLFSSTITPHVTYSSRCEDEDSDLLVHSCESKLKSKVKTNLKEFELLSHATEMCKECPETDVIPAETYSIQIIKKSQILTETKTPKFGFSLLKVKMPDLCTNVDIAIGQVSDKKDISERSEDKEHQPDIADENVKIALQKTNTCSNEVMEETTVNVTDIGQKMSSNISIPKLKMFTFEIKSSTDDTSSCHSMEPSQTTESILSESAAQPGTEGDFLEDQDDKHDNNKLPGRLKFWLPRVGFSPVDTNQEFKADIQKSMAEEAQPADPNLSTPKKKPEWFRLPKIVFSAPMKRDKTADQENMKKQVEVDKAAAAPNESTSTEEEAMKGRESIEEAGPKTPSNVVRSSARTELILLEKEEEDISDIHPKPANK
uniref:Neuroblast differentiation-associated protein AHNAK-like n=1 Tax=Geotrypetes seraphini TaxID=260995 RepID=A0A6P8RVC0_GEOSA|nr:neuroblast differentiation-associated protein AHNAK-like [Geotrypetes seraphini]